MSKTITWLRHSSAAADPALEARLQAAWKELAERTHGGFDSCATSWSDPVRAKRNLGDELIAGLRQIVDIESGKFTGSLRVHMVPRTARESDVKSAPRYSHLRVSKLRARLKLSQPIFARALNVSPETVRAWEQGKRHPDGASPATRRREANEHERSG